MGPNDTWKDLWDVVEKDPGEQPDSDDAWTTGESPTDPWEIESYGLADHPRRKRKSNADEYNGQQ